MKEIVKVEILGQIFSLSSESGEAYIKKVADYVEKKVQEILDYSKTIASFKAAILAALNIADDYHQLKEIQESLLGKISQLSQRVSETLGEEDHPSESLRGPDLGRFPVEGERARETEEEENRVTFRKTSR
jgi:cell division protein ZapA